MSHGNGGWYAGHYDTAQALAHAGFVVAALTHPGDNYHDQSHATDMAARPRELSWLIGYMLDQWPQRASLDASRVGAFGFSSGGFTTLVTIGGTPDFSAFPAHCQAHPAYFDCGLVRQAGGATAVQPVAHAPGMWVHDVRIKAAVVAAPALGFTFANGGLKDVTVPVQLWRAEADHILPHPDYAEAARLALPIPPEYHVVANADHFDFLAPCYAEQARRLPMICASRPGFDRAAFHETFDKAVVAFFLRTLG
jgi:predicted dienelactone hydrolase